MHGLVRRVVERLISPSSLYLVPYSLARAPYTPPGPRTRLKWIFNLKDPLVRLVTQASVSVRRPEAAGAGAALVSRRIKATRRHKLLGAFSLLGQDCQLKLRNKAINKDMKGFLS